MNLLLPSAPVASELPVVLDARVVSGTGGGPDKTILNSPRFFERMGYRNVCAYLHPAGDPGFEFLRWRAEAWSAPLVGIPDRGPWDWRVVPELLAVCRRERVAIWHGHDYKSNALGLLLRRLWPMRLVTTVHGWGVMGSRRISLYNRLDRLCIPYYESVICVSDRLRAECLACGVPADRCFLIENAIDLGQYQWRASREESKITLGVPPHRLVIGAIGRLSAEKGFDRLIHAADQLIRDGFDLELIIIGEGDQRGPLEALISGLGCGDRVHLPGYRSDTAGCYAAMDVYALSSLSEGLPNVILEAMAYRIPVVATCVGAVPHVIAAEQNGLLVEPGDPDPLRLALARLLGDADLRARLGDAGHRTVALNYSFERRIERIREIYDRLLSAPRAAATA